MLFMMVNVEFTLTRDMLPFDRIKWLCFIVFTLFRGGKHIKLFARILFSRKFNRIFFSLFCFDRE